MEKDIALFLYRFSRLKNEINKSPKNLSWLYKERKEIQDLCYELQGNYHSIAKFMSTKASKLTFAEVPFEGELREYERDYKDLVAAAAEPARERSLKKFEESLRTGEEDWIDSGKTKEEYWKMVQELFDSILPKGIDFNPIEDDPASLVESIPDHIKWLLELLIPDNDDEILSDFQDDFEKVLGAWQFFANTLDLNYSAIYKRWRSAPELFIPPHVAQSDETSLVELYSEAVKAYVFGNKIASIAMCRALMEHTLKNHYKIQGKKLEDIISIAERQFPQLKKLKMDVKRRLSNNMLHNYEVGADIEDQAVINYLRTIKMLVQWVQKKR